MTRSFKIMAPTPIDPDCMWNYFFCELMDLGVEINEDWYSVDNIEYDAFDDLRGDFLQLFEDDLVLVNGWEEMPQEPTEHDFYDSVDKRYHSTPL